MEVITPSGREVEQPACVQISINVDATRVEFQGHFPDFPILPGVTQIDWAARHARRIFAVATKVLHVERLKFTCPIQPNAQVVLTLTQCDNYIEFRYTSAPTIEPVLEFSQGRLVFA